MWARAGAGAGAVALLMCSAVALLTGSAAVPHRAARSGSGSGTAVADSTGREQLSPSGCAANASHYRNAGSGVCFPYPTCAAGEYLAGASETSPGTCEGCRNVVCNVRTTSTTTTTSETTTTSTTTTMTTTRPSVITKRSTGTKNWPDSACPCLSRSSNQHRLRFCYEFTSPKVVAAAIAVCKANGYASGTMTGFCQNGCAGQYSVHNWDGTKFTAETSCQEWDQSIVEYRCTY